MPLYRKRPVVIEAVQLTPDNTDALVKLFGGADQGHYTIPGMNGGFLTVHTLEGPMEAQPGDWIIKGVKDEFYPCKPDIFAQTYELVEETDADRS